MKTDKLTLFASHLRWKRPHDHKSWTNDDVVERPDCRIYCLSDSKQTMTISVKMHQYAAFSPRMNAIIEMTSLTIVRILRTFQLVRP